MIQRATYDTTDTTCTKNPTFLVYYPLGVCVQQTTTSYVKYSADSLGKVYSSPYSNAACTTSTGSDTLLPSTNCVNGVTSYLYSALTPDDNINAQVTGYIGTSITYNVADTNCASTPYLLYYTPLLQCTASGSGSSQYVADGSGYVYNRQFLATTTCESRKGSITLLKYAAPTVKKCVASGSATDGPLSSMQYLMALPTATPNKLVT